VEVDDDDLTLVMDWVDGASLSDLVRSFLREPPAKAHAVAIRIVLDACEGLHVAHELRGDDGALLGLVHRDVSPQNVLIGTDGIARLADFGLAKPLYAAERTTSEGALRGKLGYMAPEYIKSGTIDRRTDVFALGVVLWESIAQKRLFRGENDAQTIDRVREAIVPGLADEAPDLPKVAASALDSVLTRALARFADQRFPTARAFADALSDVATTHDLLATHADVAASFGPTLRAEIDARATEARAKLAALQQRSQAPHPIQALPASSRPTSKRTLALVLGGGALLVAAVPVAILLGGRSQSPYMQSTHIGSEPAKASANESANANEPPTPTPTSTSTSTSTSPWTPTLTSSSTTTPASPSTPTPSPSPTAKHPRPNPYRR